MLLKSIFSFKFVVFDSKNSSSHLPLLNDVLIYFLQKSTCNHPQLHVQSMWQIFLFQEYCYFTGMLTAINFEWIVSILGGHFQFLFRILCFFETSTCVIAPFKRIDLICHTSYRDPFFKRHLFYYKIAAVTIHSFKFTVFFRTDVPARRYHSFQLNYQLYLFGCSHVFIRRLVCYLRRHLQTFIFSMVLLLSTGTF